MSNQIDINKVVWKSEYNIGNLKIDNEHQQLFLLARKALALIDSGSQSPEQLKQIIKELFMYVKNHFTHEEEYMKQVQYPDITAHKKIHDNILAMLNTLIKEFNTLELGAIQQQLFEFIEEYFVKHIIMEDKRIHLWCTPLEELRKTFGWKSIYSVGNERIDDEHKKLFDIAQEAFSIVDNEKRIYKIKEVLINLFNYMKIHFEHEEDYMEEIDYPKIEAHKLMHENIIKTINNFSKKIQTLNVELFEKELARLIDIILVQHIIQEDRKIIEYLHHAK